MAAEGSSYGADTATGDDQNATVLQVQEGEGTTRICEILLEFSSSADNVSSLTASTPSKLTVYGYKRSQFDTAQQQHGDQQGATAAGAATSSSSEQNNVVGLPQGTPIAHISLHPRAASKDKDVKEFERFTEYLLHGLAGTSPPKAAKIKPWVSGLSKGSRIYVLPPADSSNLGRNCKLQMILSEERKEYTSSATQPSSAQNNSHEEGRVLAENAAREASDDSECNVYIIESAPSNIRGKAEHLFKDINESIRNKMKVDDVSLYSITQSRIARQQTELLLELVGPASTIVDATACVGGNTIFFAEEFKKVEAVEISQQRTEILEHNLRLNGLSHKTTIHHGDFMQMYKDIKGDIVFFDPPWGGTDYKNVDSIPLVLGDPPISIGRVCNKLFKSSACPSYVALKAPTNFDERSFEQDILGFGEIVKVHELWKMKLYIIKPDPTLSSKRDREESALGESNGSPTKQARM